MHDTSRFYAIGDIHGHLDKLKEAHRLIAEDRAYRDDWAAPVVHIGDLCDRGPDSKGVIDFIMAGPAKGGPWITLKGNHDRMMELFLQNPAGRDPLLKPHYTWLHPRLGGNTTLASYGCDVGEDPEAQFEALHEEAREKVPLAHRAFIAGLPVSYRERGLFFCHAGVRPGVPLDLQAEDDLLWIRGKFHESDADFGALVVHGHTPVDVVTHYGNRVNLDTGAGYGDPLSAVVIEGRDVWLLTEDGRVPVVHVPVSP